MKRRDQGPVTALILIIMAGTARAQSDLPPYYIFDTHLHTVNGLLTTLPGHGNIVQADGTGSCIPGDYSTAPAALAPVTCSPPSSGAEAYDYAEVLRLIDQNIHLPISSAIKRSMALAPSKGRPAGWVANGSCPLPCTTVGNCEAPFVSAAFPGLSVDERLLAARQLCAQGMRQFPSGDVDAVHVSTSGIGSCDTTTPA